jgi:hypothetical protein
VDAFPTELRRPLGSADDRPDPPAATRGSLDALAGGDATSDARAVFSWSYHHLSPQAARLFRFLGLHPGPDIDLAAAASLVGQAADAVRPVLDELS